jgi:RecB family exonuclease
VIRGSETWTEELPRLIRTQAPPPWVESESEEKQRFDARVAEQTESVDALSELVANWNEEAEQWKSLRSSFEHAAFLQGLAARWIRGWGKEDPADREVSRALQKALDDILDQVGRLGWAEHAAAGVSNQTPNESFTVPEILQFVEKAVGGASIPWRNPDGVHFLDLMQARGLTFDHLFLIGFNEHLMPRHPRENPFLPDRVREEIRVKSRKPLAVSREGLEEEWLLFAQTLASARKTLTVSWQRADAEGKALSPSLQLRELARFLPGSPSMREILEGRSEIRPIRIPTHPGEAADWFAKETGLLSREEAALVACEHTDATAPTALEQFLDDVEPSIIPSLSSGLELVGESERFTGSDLRFDGLLPEGTGWTRPFSQSSLRALGSCPMTFFFRYILGVDPLYEEAKEFRFEARELGSHMHKILDLVFQELRDQGLLGGSTPVERQIEAAERALRAHWETVLDPVARRIGGRFPLLYHHAEAFWLQEIRGFLKRDLTRLAEGDHRLESLEDPWRETILLSTDALEAARALLGPDVPSQLEVRGIPDRVTRDGNGRWLISDYKTGGKLGNDVEPKEYLMGHRVQLPLYTLMAEAKGAGKGIEAELLGLGPVFAPTGVGEDPERTATLEGDVFAETKTGFEETLAVLAASATLGRFPFRSDFHCQWCDYSSACRKTHYPTRVRVEEGPEYRAYFRTQKKRKRKPRLVDVTGNDEGSDR